VLADPLRSEVLAAGADSRQIERVFVPLARDDFQDRAHTRRGRSVRRLTRTSTPGVGEAAYFVVQLVTAAWPGRGDRRVVSVVFEPVL
jgi:hypothetical protein